MLVEPLTDHPGRTFAPGVVVHPAGPDGRAPDPELPSLGIEGARPVPKGWLVAFDGVDDRSGADLLRGRYLLRPLDEVEPSGEDELFYHELLGMRVVTSDGAELGIVSEVYELAPADLLEVRGDAGTRLIPLSRGVVVEIDRAGRRLMIDPPEGFLDL